MGAVVTGFRIGWAAIIVVSNVTLLIGFADAQLSRQKPEPGENLFGYATRPPSSDGWLPPDRRTVETVALQPKAPAPIATPTVSTSPFYNGLVSPDRVIITLGKGGLIDPHHLLYQGYKRAGTAIELHGPCYSACTLLTAYVGKDKLCIAEGAFFAFHAACSVSTGAISPLVTLGMYMLQPPEIRAWIDRNGGPEKLPLDGYWTMYDRELWAIGYPRCK